MNMPFTTEQFFNVFVSYNTAVWPAQIILFLLPLAAIYLAAKGKSPASVSVILGALWLWIGIVYHILFFSSINPAARIFGALFVVEGMLFIYSGVIKQSLSFEYKSGVLPLTGIILMLYGLIIYPILGYALGHTYPAQPTFGLPCPTTIFTFGILLWTIRMPKYLLVIPAVWTVIGFFAALNFGVWEDTGLLVSGITGTVLLMMRKKAA
jgi:hypothetical protein